MTKWQLNINFILNFKNDFSGGSMAVQCSPHSYKVEGLCPAYVAGKKREKVEILLCVIKYISFLTQWHVNTIIIWQNDNLTLISFWISKMISVVVAQRYNAHHIVPRLRVCVMPLLLVMGERKWKYYYILFNIFHC